MILLSFIYGGIQFKHLAAIIEKKEGLLLPLFRRNDGDSLLPLTIGYCNVKEYKIEKKRKNTVLMYAVTRIVNGKRRIFEGR